MDGDGELADEDDDGAPAPDDGGANDLIIKA